MEWLEKLYSQGDPPELVVGKLMTLAIVGLIVWVGCEAFFWLVERE